jgi:hypothetical protein
MSDRYLAPRTDEPEAPMIVDQAQPTQVCWNA